MNYELMYIAKPELSENQLSALESKVKELITKAKGEIVKDENWGKRNLAYPIKHFTEGVYYLTFFNLAPGKLSSVERALRLDDTILRYLMIKHD